MQNIGVIIPCYNEENRLDTTTFKIYIATKPYTFIFVDDGSSDNTLILLNNILESYPDKVRIIKLECNGGKAEAVRQGMLNAMETRKFDVIGYLDADLATPLEEIDFLLPYFNSDRKFIIGSRVKRLGAEIQRSVVRHYSGRIFATFASLLLNIKVYDSQCGAKFFREDTATFLFSEPFVSKWLFDLELLYKFKSHYPHSFCADVLEVPLRSWKEKKGSKIKIKDLVKIPVELLKIRRS